MRAWVGGLALGICALATAMDLPRWASDRALWTAAVTTSDSSRAAINLAVLALREGDVGAALDWDAEALRRAGDTPSHLPIITGLVRQHIQWILATSRSTDICDGPPWASWCASR